MLDFHGEQIEINHQKFDDLSITWNTINLGAVIAWPAGDDFRLSWRLDSPAELTALHRQLLQRVELLEYVADDMATGMTAIGFTFADGYLRIHNALDENGLAFTPSIAYHSHPPAD